MSAIAWLMLVALAVCAATLAMTIVNLRLYRRAGGFSPAPDAPVVSVCIPARNEESNIKACVMSLLASDWPKDRLEVLVYDDHSTDATGRIVAEIAADDPRVRLVPTVPLPPGWNGKQHACDRMGRSPSSKGGESDWLLFTDADVRFVPAAVRLAMGVALAPAPAGAPDAPLGLVSTFPHQKTGSLGEVLLVPMIFFLLMSYLPMGRMRRTIDPAASAGCGQFLLVRRDAYLAAGGHAAFKDSMHDGIKLPRAVRRAGFRTDLFDGKTLCSVRMYHGLAASWRGFAKNAYEGLGSFPLLVLLTVMHLVGHVLPWLYVPYGFIEGFFDGDHEVLAIIFASAAVKLSTSQRGLLAYQFGHPIVPCVVLHPVSVLLMTAVQWYSFLLHLTGRRTWRGRTLNGDDVADTAVEANP